MSDDRNATHKPPQHDPWRFPPAWVNIGALLAAASLAYWGWHIYAGLHLPSHRHAPPRIIITAITTAGWVLCGVGGLVMLARDTNVPRVTVAVWVVFALQTLVWIFALFYYLAGTGNNWSPPLDHGSALFLAVGTLTTGAPGVTPVSGAARGLMTVQMVIDLFVLTIITGFVVERLAHGPETTTSRATASESDDADRAPD